MVRVTSLWAVFLCLAWVRAEEPPKKTANPEPGNSAPRKRQPDWEIYETVPTGIPGNYAIEGTKLPVRNYVKPPPNAPETISGKPDRTMGNYKYRSVKDNPPLPPKDKGPFTVVFVAGNPNLTIPVYDKKASKYLYVDRSEREPWAIHARAEYGSAAYIFNDARNVHDLASTLKQFPKQSVNLLVVGGDSGPSKNGVFMGLRMSLDGRHVGDYKRLDSPWEDINRETLRKNSDDRKAIVESLSDDAWIQIQACKTVDLGAKDGRTILADYRAIFGGGGRRVFAAEDYVDFDDWGLVETDRGWITNAPAPTK